MSVVGSREYALGHHGLYLSHDPCHHDGRGRVGFSDHNPGRRDHSRATAATVVPSDEESASGSAHGDDRAISLSRDIHCDHVNHPILEHPIDQLRLAPAQQPGEQHTPCGRAEAPGELRAHCHPDLTVAGLQWQSCQEAYPEQRGRQIAGEPGCSPDYLQHLEPRGLVPPVLAEETHMAMLKARLQAGQPAAWWASRANLAVPVQASG